MGNLTHYLLLMKHYTIPGAILIGLTMTASALGNIKAAIFCMIATIAWEVFATLVHYAEMKKALEEQMKESIDD